MKDLLCSWLWLTLIGSLGACQLFIKANPDDLTEDTQARCRDLISNDFDDLIDCQDPDCAPFCVPSLTEDNPLACADTLDNDQDLLIDCQDPSCQAEDGCAAPLDLAVANEVAGTISLLKGDGSGVYQVNATLPAPGATNILVADFNNDGLTDLATTDIQGSQAVVFLGLGAGQFSAPQSTAVGLNPISLATADLTGDGILDLVSANFGGTLSLLSGNGDGTFLNTGDITTGQQTNFVAIRDLNQDGILDLIVNNKGDDNIGVFLRDALGALSAQSTFAVGDGNETFALGDIDGDLDLDLITGNQGSDTITRLRNDGLGGFSDRQDLLSCASPTAVQLIDLNQDGLLDIGGACFNEAAMVVHLGVGGGSFGSPLLSPVVASSSFHLSFVDVNVDGSPDLVFADQVQGGVSVHPGDDSGIFGVGNLTLTGGGARFIGAGRFFQE